MTVKKLKNQKIDDWWDAIILEEFKKAGVFNFTPESVQCPNREKHSYFQPYKVCANCQNKNRHPMPLSEVID